MYVETIWKMSMGIEALVEVGLVEIPEVTENEKQDEQELLEEMNVVVEMLVLVRVEVL